MAMLLSLHWIVSFLLYQRIGSEVILGVSLGYMIVGIYYFTFRTLFFQKEEVV